MSKHTSGPWVYREYGGTCGTNTFVVERSSYEPICTLPDNRYNAFAGEANARLIAAAPEMFELLQSIVNDYDANSGIAGEEDAENLLDAFRQIHKEASRLVSKATGE